jgi:hypothetical protein
LKDQLVAIEGKIGFGILTAKGQLSDIREVPLGTFSLWHLALPGWVSRLTKGPTPEQSG